MYWYYYYSTIIIRFYTCMQLRSSIIIILFYTTNSNNSISCVTELYKKNSMISVSSMCRYINNYTVRSQQAVQQTKEEDQIH